MGVVYKVITEVAAINFTVVLGRWILDNNYNIDKIETFEFK